MLIPARGDRGGHAQFAVQPVAEGRPGVPVARAPGALEVAERPDQPPQPPEPARGQGVADVRPAVPVVPVAHAPTAAIVAVKRRVRPDDHRGHGELLQQPPVAVVVAAARNARGDVDELRADVGGVACQARAIAGLVDVDVQLGGPWRREEVVRRGQADEPRADDGDTSPPRRPACGRR